MFANKKSSDIHLTINNEKNHSGLWNKISRCYKPA